MGSSEKMVVVVGDITKLAVDAIVNAANRSLLGGGGVDGAIHAAAGPGLLDECRALTDATRATRKSRVATACRRLTSSTPSARSGLVATRTRIAFLARCYRRSLEVAAENDLQTIAFPAISTGVYGFPVDRAAPIAVRTVSRFLRVSPGIAEVIFCCFSEESAEAHRAALGGAG